MTQKEFQKRFGGKIKNGWLVFEDNLDCSYNQLTSLPEKLRVDGDLWCSHNQLTSLPEGLEVGGSLNCSYNQLTSLPEGLDVSGSILCFNNPVPEEELKATMEGDK